MAALTKEQKEELGEKIEAFETQVGKLDRSVKKFKDLADRDPAVDDDVKEVKAALAEVTKRHSKMEVDKTDSMTYVRTLNQINTANIAAVKLVRTVDAETETFKETGWMDAIVDTGGRKVDIDDFDSTFKGVLKKIVVDKGRGDHGDTVLTDKTKCLHWVSGSQRIFGTYRNGRFTFIGHGRHTGKGNSTYEVTLIRGGKTKATTA